MLAPPIEVLPKPISTLASPGAPVEVELKLAVDPADLDRLRQHARVQALAAGSVETRSVESVYYDTEDLGLARAGLSLRLRRSGGETIQTVKESGNRVAGLFSRGEWEVPVGGGGPELDRIPDLAVRGRITEALANQDLEPRLFTNFERTEMILRDGTDALSFALDVGEISTPRGALPIHELELEHIAGRPDFAYEVALELSKSLRLHPVQLSKAERGFALMRGEHAAPQRAVHPAHSTGVNLDSAIAEIFTLSLQQLMANEAPARRGTDPEGVHQLRVATRRMLASLALFRSELPKSQRKHFKRELRWLIRQTGDARDLDVFVTETLTPASARLAEDPALGRLGDAAEEYRAEAYERVRSALESRRYTSLLLELGSWVSRRGWREQPESPQRALLFAPAREIADALLAKRYKKVKHAGRDLKHRTPEERHRLRLHVKKLRYASDSLGSLYGRKSPRRFRKNLGALQDVLGGLNDRTAADRIFDELLVRLGPEAAAPVQRLAGIVRGWMARKDEERLNHLMEEWRGFGECDPFWESDAA